MTNGTIAAGAVTGSGTYQGSDVHGAVASEGGTA